MVDFTPRMPDARPVQEGVVDYARDVAFDPVNRRLVMITPDRRIKTSPILPSKHELPIQFVVELESIAPSAGQWLIVAIGLTDPDALALDMYRCVPFMGMLQGLSQIGHAVVLFEGHEEALGDVCKDANLLIVDDAMIPFLAEDWMARVLGSMRNPYIIRIKREEDSISAERLVINS